MQAISNEPTPTLTRSWLSPLVVLSACLVLVGAAGSLLTRVYFVQGGQRLWLSTMIQVSGWPLLLPPICASLLLRRHRDDGGSIAGHLLSPRLTGAVAVLGVFFALSCFAYSLGSQTLPLSTSSLLQATQLTFNAVSAFLFAGLRFTPFSVNAVVLLTIGPAALGVGPSSDKPVLAGEGSSTAYWTGFVECITSAALLGLVLPLVEVAMSKYGRRSGPAAVATRVPPTYATVMQIQVVMGAAGTTLCLVGMAVAKDFQAMPREAATFGLGEANYYLLLVSGAVSWQLFNLGTMGLIIFSSSLLAGIMIALVLPLSEVLAIIFLHEKFDGVKGIALVLSLWGFVSYLYGESTQKKMEAKQVAVGSEDLESICCPLMATVQ